MKQAVKRKTLTGNWEAFSFPKKARSFFVKNFTDGDIFVSFENNDSEDESFKIAKGLAEQIEITQNGFEKDEYYSSAIYVKGAGEVEVQALDIKL